MTTQKTGSIEVEMNSSSDTRKINAVYNYADNLIYVNSRDGMLYVVCTQEEQLQTVIDKVVPFGNKLVDYKEVLEDGIQKWIITFDVPDDEYVWEQKEVLFN